MITAPECHLYLENYSLSVYSSSKPTYLNFCWSLPLEKSGNVLTQIVQKTNQLMTTWKVEDMPRESGKRTNTDLVKEGKLLQCPIFPHCRHWQIFGTSQLHLLLLKEQAVIFKMFCLKYHQIPLCWHRTAPCKGWDLFFPQQWSGIAVSHPHSKLCQMSPS